MALQSEKFFRCNLNTYQNNPLDCLTKHLKKMLGAKCHQNNHPETPAKYSKKMSRSKRHRSKCRGTLAKYSKKMPGSRWHQNQCCGTWHQSKCRGIPAKYLQKMLKILGVRHTRGRKYDRGLAIRQGPNGTKANAVGPGTRACAAEPR